MITTNEHLAKLDVLIDADNISPKVVNGLFKEIATIGEASVRRIYGDFAGTRLKGWAEVLAAHAIMPHQNFANVGGKNASDIALVIDAMDLMHSGRFDGFCLVSSDSDFTRLAARIREQGIAVYGFGEQKTPANGSSIPKTSRTTMRSWLILHPKRWQFRPRRSFHQRRLYRLSRPR